MHRCRAALVPGRTRQFYLHGGLDRVVVVARDELCCSQTALDEALQEAPVAIGAL